MNAATRIDQRIVRIFVPRAQTYLAGLIAVVPVVMNIWMLHFVKISTNATANYIIVLATPISIALIQMAVINVYVRKVIAMYPLLIALILMNVWKIVIIVQQISNALTTMGIIPVKNWLYLANSCSSYVLPVSQSWSSCILYDLSFNYHNYL